MAYGVRSDFPVHVEVEHTSGRTGEIRRHLWVGTVDELTVSLTETLASLIRHPGDDAVTIRPIHPMNVVHHTAKGQKP
jgi:hypothetical protein